MQLNPLLFECRFGHFPPEIFRVLSVLSQKDGLSLCPEYCIDLLIPHHIDVASLKSLPVQLFLYPEQKTHLSSRHTPHLVTQGHISGYEKRNHENGEGYYFRIWVESWFARLKNTRQSRVFVEQTPETITTRILTENQISPSDWQWHADTATTTTVKKLPLLLQIDENDADFLQRLWANQGYAFVFDPAEHASVLHIADVKTLPFVITHYPLQQTLTYHAQKGMTRQPGQCFDWSYTIKENMTPVLTLATLAQDIQPGHRIQFTEPEYAWLSGPYLVIERRMTADISHAHQALDYHCSLDLIPLNTNFSLPRFTAPVYAGLRTAYLEHNHHNDSAENAGPILDELGAYCLRFPFDTTRISTDPNVSGVHFATPFGGPGYGWHFPLRPGTQVVLTLRDTPEGGHEATIVGTLPDTHTPEPTDIDRPSCHRLRTHRENTFEADDHVNTGYTALFTHHRDNEVQLSANKHDNTILLRSKKQAIHLAAEQDVCIESQAHIQVHAKANMEETIENTYTLRAQQDIHMKTTDACVKAAKEIRLLSQTNSIIDTALLQWSAKKILSLKVIDGMHCWVEECTLSAPSITLNTTSDAPFVLVQGEAQCQFDASGNMGLYANRFFIEAPRISIYSNSEQNR